MDWERGYFMSSTETSNPAAPHARECWRTVTDKAENFDLEIPLSEFVSTYYKMWSQADRHNRWKQDHFRLENVSHTNDWSLRLNMSLLNMIIVDSWSLYKGATEARSCIKQIQFFLNFAEDFIDNNYDRARKKKNTGHSVEEIANSWAAGSKKYLKPTNEKRKTEDCTSLYKKM